MSPLPGILRGSLNYLYMIKSAVFGVVKISLYYPCLKPRFSDGTCVSSRPWPGHRPSLHYGKLSVTRRTFLLGANISSFADVFEPLCPDRVGSKCIGLKEYQKRPLENVKVVSALVPTVQCWHICLLENTIFLPPAH